MCGIVGMVGADVFGATVKALGRLEYRGYDSYGFAYRREDGVAIIKSVGAIGDAILSDSFAQSYRTRYFRIPDGQHMGA